MKGTTTVPIDDVRSFLSTGKFPGKATDPLQAMIRKGMVKTDKDRRAKVKAYAEAFVMARRASKGVFPIMPDKLSKPAELSKIVSLEEALERAKPRTKAKGGKRSAASEEKKKSAAKKRKEAPPAKKPAKKRARAAEKYSPSFP